MKEKLHNADTQVAALEAEQSLIESQTTHAGFRDASLRNRIEEQLSDLDETLRQERSSLPAIADNAND